MSEWERHDLTEYQRAIHEALRPLVQWTLDNWHTIEQVNQSITEAGQRMADDAENYANEERE